jgi:CdiI immunity protein
MLQRHRGVEIETPVGFLRPNLLSRIASMNRRRSSRKSKDSSPAHRISATRFPILAEFCAGYLHQDFVQEYGSPEEAVRAFKQDASVAEVRRLKAEWLGLIRALKGQPIEEIRKTFSEQLGASWSPRSYEDLEAVTSALET